MLSSRLARGLCLLLTACMALVLAGCPDSKTVAVPDVTGMPQLAAQLALTGTGLSVETVSQQESDTVAAGNVISQSPAAGLSVAQGTPVNLVVACASSSVSVPNVVGLSQTNASTSLSNAGLCTGAVTKLFSSSVPYGCVISQSPLPGSAVASGCSIDLVISGGPASVVVPNTVGLTQSAATDTLAAVGLPVGTVARQSSRNIPAGTVISQAPGAGTTVPANSAVDLAVSSGPASVTVPNVMGFTQSVAASLLSLMGLTEGDISEQFSGTIAAGRVISQAPAANSRALAGDSVDLVLSRGPAPLSVPDVVGLARATAESTLTSAGLTIGAVTEEYNAAVPEGDVIRQYPVAGADAAPGDPVNLAISGGEAPVTLPNVMGLTQAAAEYSLTFSGLVLGTVTQAYSDTIAAGRVMSQDPPKDSSVASGSAVNLVLSKGPEPVIVPNIVGIARAAAESALTDANLRVGSATLQFSDTVPEGHIISQNPAAGTSILPTSPVDFVVSLGPEPVLVPDVKGLTQTEAEAALVAGELTVGTVTEEYSDTVPEGQVISQNPVAGASVLPGTAIAFTVSKGVEPLYVPSLYRMNQTEARTAILAARLAVGVVSEDYSTSVPSGLVFLQSPPAGTATTAGTAVDFVISKGPEPVEVPEVVGLTQEAAEAAIVAARLTVGNVTGQPSDTVPPGNIISQDPASSTMVLPGSPINLIISSDADLAVDRTAVRLSFLSRRAGLNIHNVGGDTLSWTAAVNDSRLSIDPSSFTGNSKIAWIAARDFSNISQSFSADLSFANILDSSDIGHVKVYFSAIAHRLHVNSPKCSFEMGDPYSEGQPQELPVHTVTLSRFTICQCPVPVSEYVLFLNVARGRGDVDAPTSEGVVMGYGRPLLTGVGTDGRITYEFGQFRVGVRDTVVLGDHPAVVTWYGAAAYCNWYSELFDLQPCYDTTTWKCDFLQSGFHLPTEAQWERAAAWDGAKHWRYGFSSDTIDSTRCNYACNNPQSIPDLLCTTPVGYFDGFMVGTTNSQSPLGCYDMSGNIWEWCNDWCDYDYYANSPTLNPTGPSSGTVRAIRGGGCHDSAQECRTSLRYSRSPDMEFGFRVAATYAEPTRVPIVIGLTRSAAEAAIIAARLTVGTVTEGFHEAIPAGSICGQGYFGELSVLPGTPIDLHVSLGPAPGRRAARSRCLK